MILLDFYSGSHGHFLEYLINSYIFNGIRVKNVFTKLGTSHGIKQDLNYMSNRVVYNGHYTEFNITPSVSFDQIIRISVNSQMEKIIYQVNVMTRAGDIPEEKKIQELPELVRNNPVQLRNDYFSKLNDCGYIVPENWRWNNLPSYEFPMGSLYNLYDLYKELKSLALFLKFSFKPDDSLFQIWQEFMQKNHGYNHWIQAQNILTKSLANESHSFTADAWTQAIVNYLISQTIGMFDGDLFENPTYPSNTQTVYALIQQYIHDFDLKF